MLFFIYRMDWIISLFNFDLDAFLELAGSDPFSAMWYLFTHGAWILIVYIILWIVVHAWKEYASGKAAGKREWILLKVAVPGGLSEQTARAAENMLITFAGGHTTPSWTETWITGFAQSYFSLEMASIEGRVSFYIFGERRFRDLAEGAIYAQYPAAEIQEVEDYTKDIPSHYPDEEWDAWGTEMIPVKEDPYILKTYPQFEDKVSGEFKDPVAYMLEFMSRLGKDEHFWYQIVITQTDHKGPRERAEKLINKIKGVKEEHKMRLIDHVTDLPMNVAKEAAGILLSSPSAAPPAKKDAKQEFPRMFALSPGEKEVLEGIERKTAQVGYMTKIRFVYAAKKEIIKKTKAIHTFIGAMKQTNTFHMQSLKPELKKVGMASALWLFKDQRNNHRKSHVVKAYKKRSNWMGMPQFFMCAEELATLWHFPILMQVKAPSITKVDAKKAEAPANLPFG